MMPSLSDLELSRLRRKPSCVDAILFVSHEIDLSHVRDRAYKEVMRANLQRAMAAAVVSKCYENLGDPSASQHYQEEAMWFEAKALEAVAFESAEGN